MRPAAMVWQTCVPHLRHLRTGSVLTLKPWDNARGLRGAGDCQTYSRGGAGLEVDGQHQVLLRRRDGRRIPSKRQAYCSIAKRTRSQQRSDTKQPEHRTQKWSCSWGKVGYSFSWFARRSRPESGTTFPHDPLAEVLCPQVSRPTRRLPYYRSRLEF
jgi:hypothetical protein